MGFRKRQNKAIKEAIPEIEKHKADEFMNDFTDLCRRHKLKLIAVPRIISEYKVVKLSDKEIEEIDKRYEEAKNKAKLTE